MGRHFEHHRQPLADRRAFARPMLRYVAVSCAIILGSLAVGIIGYHYTEGLPWLDSLLNASMILGGMGPVDRLDTAAAKLFASFYALFSGIVGQMGRYSATMDGEPYPYANLTITRPDGTSFNATAGANGEYEFVFDMRGRYGVALVHGGAVVQSRIATVAMAPPPTPAPAPTFFEEAAKNWWWLLLVLAVVSFLVWRYGRGQRKK